MSMSTPTQYKISEAAVAELQTALDYLTEHPEEHDQQSWIRKTACGTACCIAGRIVLNHPEMFRVLFDKGGDFKRVEALNPDLDAEDVAEAAGVILGIEPDWYCHEFSGGPAYTELTAMFDGNRPIGELWRRAQQLAEGRLLSPTLNQV